MTQRLALLYFCLACANGADQISWQAQQDGSRNVCEEGELNCEQVSLLQEMWESKLQQNYLGHMQNCGSAPELESQKLDELISQTPGILLVAMKDMRCTQAVEAAMQSKGIASTTKYFSSSSAQPGTEIPTDASEVWKWLHCTSNNDGNMHSYVFKDGSFIGNGFQAAELIKSGQLAGEADQGEVVAKSCEERFPNQAKVVENYQNDPKNRVLLFGWQGCPCTGIAKARFGAEGICYEGRTWNNPSSKMMDYLQCKEKDDSHHSFIYFRTGSESSSSWEFFGNGFALDQAKFSKDALDSKVALADGKTGCKEGGADGLPGDVNIYGQPLEECRLPSDEAGGAMSGSWMDDGKCTESTGGIHQICIKRGTLPHNFSMSTYQSSDWSENRVNYSHCICIGAWSTYMTEESKHPEETQKITPRCKAIPETVLTKQYMSNWKHWNGFVANVGMGMSELMERCLTIEDEASKCELKKRFMKLNDEEPVVQNLTELDAVREKLQQVHCSVCKLNAVPSATIFAFAIFMLAMQLVHGLVQ